MSSENGDSDSESDTAKVVSKNSKHSKKQSKETKKCKKKSTTKDVKMFSIVHCLLILHSGFICILSCVTYGSHRQQLPLYDPLISCFLTFEFE